MINFAYTVNQVLHMDRNDYYGGESSSLNLIQVLCLKSFVEIFSRYLQIPIIRLIVLI